MDGWMKRGGGEITSSGLNRLRSNVVQRRTHEVFEELKDTILWDRFAYPNYLECMYYKKISSFNQDKLKIDWSTGRNE